MKSSEHKSKNQQNRVQQVIEETGFVTANTSFNLSNPLTPKMVVPLQRMVGNYAVQRMIKQSRAPLQTIQRRFAAGSTLLAATVTTEQTQKIADAMDAYNAFLDKDDPGSVEFGEAAGLLKTIERTIYAYFDSQNATHQTLASIPHYTQLEAVRKQAAKEHEDFVQMAVEDDSQLPFDFEGMPHQEAWSLILLWNKIKKGTGKIQLIGDPANKKQMLSWLVKLLETPTGRELLGYLNAGDPTEALTNIYIGQTKDQLPGGVEAGAKAGGKEVEDKTISEAQPLGSTGEMSSEPITGQEDPSEYIMATTVADFKKALLEGKKGAILNGRKYEFSDRSVGAFVTAFEGESRNESASHNQIATPGWVTLGHELGHAAHFKGGGTNMLNNSIMEDITGANPEKLNTTWQNSEEFVTISNWENSLRSDVGLTGRSSHIPYTAGKKTERYYNIWPDIKATFPDGAYMETPVLSEYKTKLRAAFNSKDSAVNLENDVVYQTLSDRWLVIRAMNLDAEARTVKRERLVRLFNRLKGKYEKRAPIWEKTWFKGKQRKLDWADLVRRYNEIDDIVKNNLDAHIDLNVPAATSLVEAMVTRIETLEDDFVEFIP